MAKLNPGDVVFHPLWKILGVADHQSSGTKITGIRTITNNKLGNVKSNLKRVVTSNLIKVAGKGLRKW